MGDTLRNFLKRTFDIREGELPRAALMQVNIFLIISTLLIVKPTVNGLFLSKFGVESLPYAFILVALVAAIVSTVYSRLLLKVPLNRIITGTLYFSVVSLLIFGLFLRFDFLLEWTLYLFYVWVAIFALLATSQFWVLANIVFNAREAKRLFGFIGAGAVAGGIFGGYLTSLLTQFMSSEFLLFVSAALLALCIPVNRRIWKRNVVGLQTPFQQKKRAKGFGEHPARLVLQSRHLTYLSIIVGVSVVVAKLVDYQFGGIASALIPDADELTAFFGFWFSTFNLISLLMQLFVTRRVVGSFGVGSSLLFLPISILLAVILLFVFPELLLAAVFLKMADSGLKQSVNKAALELMILPVPVDIKNQTKTFIDVFIDSLATGISGLLLIFLVKGLDLSTLSISVMILIMLLIWLFMISKVKREYLHAFRLKLDEVKEPAVKKKIDLSNESVFGGLRKVLESGTEKQRIFVLKKVRGMTDQRLFDSLVRQLDHPSEEVKTEAIHSLYFFRDTRIADKMEALTHHPSQAVKIAALEYLIEVDSTNWKTFMNRYLEDEDYRLSGAAMVSIATETRDNPQLKQLFELPGLMQGWEEQLSKIDDGEEKKVRTISLLKAIGFSRTTAFYPVIEQYLDSKDPEIAGRAILSAGDTLHSRFLPILIRHLIIPAHRTYARTALVNYGSELVGSLRSMIDAGEVSLEEIRMIPSVIKQIGTQNAVNLLFELFDYDDIVVRREALRGLNMLRNNHPQLQFSKKDIAHRILNEAKLYQEMLSALYAQIRIKVDHPEPPETAETIEARNGLIRLLERRLDRNLEHIFRLLGLNYPNGDIFIIYKGLRSPQPDMRTNALEFLDNLLEPSLKKTLIPIVETSMLETITEEVIKNMKINVPDEYQCYRLLLNSKDIPLKIAVLYLLQQLKDQRFLQLVEDQKESSNSKVRKFATQAEEKIREG